MLDMLRYENHLGEVISFGENGIFANGSDLRNFAWAFTNKNNRLSNFHRGISTKTLNVIIACGSEAEGIAKRNTLFECCEKDVIAKKHGKIIIGDYYMKCFIAGSNKSNFLYSKNYMAVSLSIVTDFPAWVKESTTTFRKLSGSAVIGGKNFDYPLDYAFDYTSDIKNRALVNGDFAPTNFRMYIFGACVNPQIYIAGHAYNVNTEIAAGEYVVIDSVAKTVELVRNNGEKVNCFNDRSRDSYLFEKISPGVNYVSWDGDFGFDITLLEERSEPKWI